MYVHASTLYVKRKMSLQDKRPLSAAATGSSRGRSILKRRPLSAARRRERKESDAQSSNNGQCGERDRYIYIRYKPKGLKPVNPWISPVFDVMHDTFFTYRACVFVLSLAVSFAQGPSLIFFIDADDRRLCERTSAFNRQANVCIYRSDTHTYIRLGLSSSSLFVTIICKVVCVTAVVTGDRAKA